MTGQPQQICVAILLALLSLSIGCDRSAPQRVANGTRPSLQPTGDSETIPEKTNPVTPEVAGRLPIHEFEAKYKIDGKSMHGQVWEITGFLNEKCTRFRKNATQTSIEVRLTKPPTGEEMHPCREVTVRGVVRPYLLVPEIANAEIVSMGEHPAKRVSTAKEVFDVFESNASYADMKFYNGVYRSPARIKIRGKVITTDSFRAVYLDAGEGRFLKLSSDANAFPQNVRLGADTIFEAVYSGIIVDGSDILALRDSEVLPQDSQPGTEVDASVVVEFSAKELLQLVLENQKTLRDKLVVLEVPEKDLENIVRHIVVTGEITSFFNNGVQFIKLKASDEGGNINFAMLPNESIDGLKEGDQISIAGLWEAFDPDSTELDIELKSISVDKGRIWKSSKDQETSSASTK